MVKVNAQVKIASATFASQREVNAWANDPAGPLYLLLDELGVRTQMLAKRYVRVHTGRLQGTIRKRRGKGSSPSVEVVAGLSNLTPYVFYEHDGTVPHIIRARNRKTLRFIDRRTGELRFPVQVRHPGTTGSRFLTRAIDEVSL